MNNPTVILNGDQVYCDELIRENARLTIQHEVDRQKMEALERQIEDQAANIASLEAHSYAREDLEELADLLEVMQAVVKARGWTLEELEQLRADKAARRGGFEKKILLKEILEG